MLVTIKTGMDWKYSLFKLIRLKIKWLLKYSVDSVEMTSFLQETPELFFLILFIPHPLYHLWKQNILINTITIPRHPHVELLLITPTIVHKVNSIMNVELQTFLSNTKTEKVEKKGEAT